ncbi:MAG: hypothetical protein HYU63_07450 [Armatimonadetes bacterium]|nr:hypothetical protein [Armatimonadota bacterium]
MINYVNSNKTRDIPDTGCIKVGPIYSPVNIKKLKERVDLFYYSKGTDQSDPSGETYYHLRDLKTYFDKDGILRLYERGYDEETPEVRNGLVPLRDVSALKKALDYIIGKYPQLTNQKPWFTTCWPYNSPPKVVRISIPKEQVNSYKAAHTDILVNFEGEKLSGYSS